MALVLKDATPVRPADRGHAALRHPLEGGVRAVVTQTSFDPSTLVYWRKRIAASDRRDQVFDAVARVIAETRICAAVASVPRFDGLEDAVATRTR